MVDGTLRWVIRHEKRAWIVITLTFITGILLVLPAVEEYSAATERTRTAREKLEEAKRQVENLPQLKQTFEKKKQQLTALEGKAIAEKDVVPLREILQKLIRETGCTMRTLNVDEVAQPRPWMTNDSPLRNKVHVDPGPVTNFNLLIRTTKLQIDGPMSSVYQFMSRISQLDRFIHVKHVRLERSARDENVTQLEMEFDMFDLARKTSA